MILQESRVPNSNCEPDHIPSLMYFKNCSLLCEEERSSCDEEEVDISSLWSFFAAFFPFKNTQKTMPPVPDGPAIEMSCLVNHNQWLSRGKISGKVVRVSKNRILIKLDEYLFPLN